LMTNLSLDFSKAAMFFPTKPTMHSSVPPIKYQDSLDPCLITSINSMHHWSIEPDTFIGPHICHTTGMLLTTYSIGSTSGPMISPWWMSSTAICHVVCCCMLYMWRYFTCTSNAQKCESINRI
jgi:hypothetical protein